MHWSMVYQEYGVSRVWGLEYRVLKYSNMMYSSIVFGLSRIGVKSLEYGI